MIDIKGKKKKKLREWKKRMDRNKNAPSDFTPSYDPKPT